MQYLLIRERNTRCDLRHSGRGERRWRINESWEKKL